MRSGVWVVFVLVAVLVLVAGAVRDCQDRHVEDDPHRGHVAMITKCLLRAHPMSLQATRRALGVKTTADVFA